MTQWCVEGKNGNLPCIPNFKDAENYGDKRYNSAPNCILCADFVRKSLIIGLNWSNIQYQPDHSQVTIIYLVTWPNKYLTAFYNAVCVKAALQFTLNTGQTKTGRLILGCNSQIVQRTHLVPVVLSRWPFRWQGLRRGSVSAAVSS